MKSHHRYAVTALFIATLGALSVSNAALVDQSGGLIYDTDRNITWLANANLADSNTFGVSGIGTDSPGDMTWDTAVNWISAMNANNYLGYSDWRMPTTLQPDPTCTYQVGGVSARYGCTGSEMGHLFSSELGGNFGESIFSTHNSNLSLFQNFQLYYWSGTEYAPDTSQAWNYQFDDGFQGADLKNGGALYNVLVVRDGNSVPATPSAVPLPAAVWLFGSGLLGLIGIARRKAA